MSLKKLVIPATIAALSLALTGCSLGATPEASAPSSTISVDKDAVALLPGEIAESGVLTFGVGTDYPPNESVDENGNPSGWGIELAEAIAQQQEAAAALDARRDYSSDED